jgi:hypothetical protein
MLQRALQATPPHLAPEILGVRALFRNWADHGLLILRRLSEFFVTGGPMS